MPCGETPDTHDDYDRRPVRVLLLHSRLNFTGWSCTASAAGPAQHIYKCVVQEDSAPSAPPPAFPQALPFQNERADSPATSLQLLQPNATEAGALLRPV